MAIWEYIVETDSQSARRKGALMATADTIRQIARAQPFQPFTMRLIDGSEYDVSHPDYVSVPPSPRAREVLYYLPVNGDSERFQMRWIDVGLISEVIVSPPPLAPPPPGLEANGSE